MRPKTDDQLDRQSPNATRATQCGANNSPVVFHPLASKTRPHHRTPTQTPTTTPHGLSRQEIQKNYVHHFGEQHFDTFIETPLPNHWNDYIEQPFQGSRGAL